MAANLTTDWGRPVIVENKPGANTMIAADTVARSPADGHTILFTADVTLTANQYLYSKLPYNPTKDFIPVFNSFESVQVLVASPALPAQTLQEVISIAKKKPGGIFYGSWGLGSSAHLDMEAIASNAGIKLTHVPYKGVSDLLTALMTGEIQLSLSAVQPAIEQIRSGKVRAIAYAGTSRSSLLPGVPTFAESGMPNFSSRAWFGFLVPAGTSPAVVNKLAADLSRASKNPSFVEKHVTSVGLNLLNQGPEEFRKVIELDSAEFAKRIKNANVKLD